MLELTIRSLLMRYWCCLSGLVELLFFTGKRVSNSLITLKKIFKVHIITDEFCTARPFCQIEYGPISVKKYQSKLLANTM